MAKKKMLKNEPWFEEYLRTSYIDERKTMAQIAEEVGCSAATILNHLRRLGVETRSAADYPATDAVRDAWVEIGRSGKGRRRTAAQKDAISKANRGKRKRSDYEFGGHEKKRRDGYIAVYVPDHPNCNREGYVMKHHLVMEREIGRKLLPGEVVHHKNRIRDDNRIENLQLMTASEHMSMHNRERHMKGA